ncbi:FAD-binding oxidoreductase [Georgenia sp. TF02-10]|uniref:NAD(P)/FAD-dependent oxidoreductase n=1 Tax=Georgenia sp. TF02-10 TaxID=2917725 RepID=UPI001FA7F7A5|nr:FAD-binding oxidoreductase [Georgenia sp. TF02-10]UNX54939.1 FAD-binding oxidoreductase [Georgenia sp. TF02-10]
MPERVHNGRVAVVGGGVLGAATATALAREGAHATLVTDAQLSSGASGRSLSWLNSYGRRSDAYHQLRMLGLDRYRRLAAGGDVSDWLRFDGGLTWAPAGRAERHQADFEHMRRVGYDAQWLSRDDVAARIPGVDPAAIPDEGAIFNPGEGWVELPSLIEHLAHEFVSAGGTVVENAGRSTVVVSDDTVTGVRTASGKTLEVDAAVLATGPAVPAMLADVGVTVPDATPVSLLVRTPPVGADLRSVLNTPRVAIRPAPDGCLVMDAGWSEREIVIGENGSYGVHESTLAGLLEEGSRVLAGNPTLELKSYGVGPKPIPGDGEPVVGELPGITGYHVIFTHSGATLALIIGELLAREVVTGTPSPLLSSFRPGRFGA